MIKLNFRQQVLIGFAISIILVFVVGIFSYNDINQLQEDNNWVDHSYQMIETSDQLLQNLVDAETGTRGFVASGSELFLQPFDAALPQITLNLDKLKKLIANDADQQKIIVRLAAAVQAQEGILRKNIAARKNYGLQYILQQDILSSGKVNMDNIRLLVKSLRDSEYRLLNERKVKTAQSTSTTIVTIVSGSVIFLVIILLLFVYIQRTFNQQKETEAIITSTNQELQQVLAENEQKNWLLTGTARLNDQMQGQQSERELSDHVLQEICTYSSARSGTLYLYNQPAEVLELFAQYAFHDLDVLKNKIRLGEGWIGQVAKNRKSALVKAELNNKHLIQTGSSAHTLSQVYIVPFFYDKVLKGVIELAFEQEPADSIKNYIERVSSDVGIAVNTAQARTIMQDLFAETQQQAEELEAQQEEMRVTNEELLSKTEMLQASEEELRVQQDELRAINAELEEKASLLEEKNQAIEQARLAINEKVKELEASGRYKSEFLANMSHELRTPLNSILVLARILKENKAGNLSEDQTKYARVIFNAGNDLLTLINDILDLSKIESGKLEMLNESVRVAEIAESMESLFAELAAHKKISFTTSWQQAPVFMVTDKVRVEQVIKNLLSNAFKFTSEGGSIVLDIRADATGDKISFSVKDTGIGIPYEKQKIIFEAFQQADGSTNRKYGGTGLGLSISRELAALLGGQLSLVSEPGVGSEFTLTLPVTAADVVAVSPTVKEPEPVRPVTHNATPLPKIVPVNTEARIVIVEDDVNFAGVLKTYAEEHGYTATLVHDGLSAVDVIIREEPDAVILDIMLPGKDGWQILKELKHHPATAHIPVHLMSGAEASINKVQNEGAISFLKKPIDIEQLDHLFEDLFGYTEGGKQVLLVEDHQDQSEALKKLLEDQQITVDQAFTGEKAFELLQSGNYQCVILDLNLPDVSGLDLLDRIKAIDRFHELPVIINTAMELDKEQVNRLMSYTHAMVIKTAKSADRLIDEVNLFLHKVSAEATQPGTGGVKAPSKSSTKTDLLKGKKVLLVDDDMRNIFALSSALQSYDLEVEIANDGEEALEKLDSIIGVDLVLMDIMMPKMDGYEAMREIRKQSRFKKLPVIALTAKAMKDDKEKCIAAGANDYITKPVDVDRLIAMMQLWLSK